MPLMQKASSALNLESKIPLIILREIVEESLEWPKYSRLMMIPAIICKVLIFETKGVKCHLGDD